MYCKSYKKEQSIILEISLLYLYASMRQPLLIYLYYGVSLLFIKGFLSILDVDHLSIFAVDHTSATLEKQNQLL